MPLPSHDNERDVVVVTTARLSHSADIALRERRYVITQLVRVVCVLLGVLLPVSVPFKLALFIGAVCLPWFGVVAANAGPAVVRRKRSAIKTDLRATLPDQAPMTAIEPGRIVDAAP